MSDEEIRIKIAESLGWKWNASTDVGGKAFPECWAHDEHGFAWQVADLPNYPESLDACAEFEATLTVNERLTFRNLLVRAQAECPYPDTYAVSATARQRCLAYLKTKGIIP